jgi:hypothetical protein
VGERSDGLVRRWRRCAFIALAVCSFAGPLGEAQDDAKPAAEVSRVQFELLRSLHIALEVKINDVGPRRLIFDLGAPINLVSGRFAAESGLISKEAAERKAFFGMRGDKVAKKVQIGEVVAEDVQVMVMDHPTIKAISEILGPIDGIIGYPFFARYKFAIDYPAAAMTFTPGEYKPQNVMNQMLGRMFGSRDTKKKHITPNGLWGIELARPADGGSGVVVTRVWPSSPAAEAGLRVDDRIVTVASRWTDSPAEAAAAAGFAKGDASIALEVVRDGADLKLELNPALGL